MKKINKSLKFLLALSIFLSTGAPVSARTVTNPGGTNPSPTAPIEVRSNIGAFNPLDPGQPAPVDPENPTHPYPNHPAWLNVSVPEVVMFHSTGADHTELTSPNHTITNHSMRGVDVYVNSFSNTDGDYDPITALSLIANPDDNLPFATSVPLMNGTALIGTLADPAHLMTITYNDTFNQTQDATFRFAGAASVIAEGSSSVAPVFDLVLGFRVNSLGLDNEPFASIE